MFILVLNNKQCPGDFPIGQLNKSQTKDRAESMASSAEWDFSCSELACQLKLGGRPID